MPRRYFNYAPEFESLHQLSTYGTWIIGIGFILMMYTLLKPIPGEAGPNPYKSVSLEWSMDSPPPPLNFDKIPTITEPVYNYGTKIEKES